MDLGQLVGDSICDIGARSGTGISAENDTVAEGDGHAEEAVKYRNMVARQARAELED